MARSIPEGRFGQLVEAATTTFISRGYRLTQVADVATALGLGKGTLYGYVESKEALFDAAVRYADGQTPMPQPADLPLRSPAPGSTVAYVRERVAAEAGELALLRIVTGGLVVQDPAEELSVVLSDLYRRIARNRRALKLVDRCAADYPELAQVWFGEGRWAQHQLLMKLIVDRAAQGRIRRVAHPDVVARTMLESIAFWAMHRHFDPSPQPVDDATAANAVIDLLVNGLLEGP